MSPEPRVIIVSLFYNILALGLEIALLIVCLEMNIFYLKSLYLISDYNYNCFSLGVVLCSYWGSDS